MFLQQNHVTAGGANASITVGDVCELDVLLAKNPFEWEFSPPARTDSSLVIST